MSAEEPPAKVQSTEEPPAKVQRTEDAADVADVPKPTGWESYTLNVEDAIGKGAESRHFAVLADAPVDVLLGVGPHAVHIVEHLGIKTVRDLATYKYFLVARAIAVLAPLETEGGRLPNSRMNIDKAVVSAHESKTLKELVDASVDALEGISSPAVKLLGAMGCKTIGQLAAWKYALWSEALVKFAEYEHTSTGAERKQEALLKRLE